MHTQGKLSRRDFLKTSGAMAGAALLGAHGLNVTRVAMPARQAEVQLRLLTWETGAGLELFKEIVNRFQEQNPDVAVEVSTPAGDYYTVLQTQVAGGSPPDLIQIGEAYLPPWAENGVLLPLDDYLSVDPDGKPEDFYEAIFKVFSYEGSTYVLPKDFVTWGLYYNKTLFDAAGVEYPDDTWTEADYLEAAIALTIKEGDRFVQYGQLVSTGWGNYFPMIWQHGGRYLDETLTKCLLNEPEAVEALQWWADTIHVHGTAPIPGATGAETPGFNTGKVAMQIEGSYNVPGYNQITDFDWDIAEKPAGPEGRASILYGSGFGISSQSAYPDEAWEFVKFMTYEGSELLAAQGFSVPSRKSVASKPGVYVGAEKTAGRNVETFIKAVEYAGLQELTSTWNEQSDIITAEFDRMWLGQATAEEATAAIVPQIEELLASEAS